jgi:hypothetical protein
MADCEGEVFSLKSRWSVTFSIDCKVFRFYVFYFLHVKKFKLAEIQSGIFAQTNLRGIVNHRMSPRRFDRPLQWNLSSCLWIFECRSGSVKSRASLSLPPPIKNRPPPTIYHFEFSKVFVFQRFNIAHEYKIFSIEFIHLPTVPGKNSRSFRLNRRLFR